MSKNFVGGLEYKLDICRVWHKKLLIANCRVKLSDSLLSIFDCKNIPIQTACINGKIFYNIQGYVCKNVSNKYIAQILPATCDIWVVV